MSAGGLAPQDRRCVTPSDGRTTMPSIDPATPNAGAFPPSSTASRSQSQRARGSCGGLEASDLLGRLLVTPSLDAVPPGDWHFERGYVDCRADRHQAVACNETAYVESLKKNPSASSARDCRHPKNADKLCTCKVALVFPTCPSTLKGTLYRKCVTGVSLLCFFAVLTTVQ